MGVTLHGVVMERDDTIPWIRSGKIAGQRFRFGYAKMTYANMPPSSPDVSHIAKSTLMRTSGAKAHSGGVNVGFADGSVKFVR